MGWLGKLTAIDRVELLKQFAALPTPWKSKALAAALPCFTARCPAAWTGRPSRPGREEGRVRLHDQTADAPFGAYAEAEQAAPRG